MEWTQFAVVIAVEKYLRFEAHLPSDLRKMSTSIWEIWGIFSIRSITRRTLSTVQCIVKRITQFKNLSGHLFFFYYYYYSHSIINTHNAVLATVIVTLQLFNISVLSECLNGVSMNHGLHPVIQGEEYISTSGKESGTAGVIHGSSASCRGMIQ